VVDFSGSAHGYMVDQTRMFAVGGVSARIRKGYEDMLKVQGCMKDIAKPGVSWGYVYNECHKLAMELGYKDSFMGCAGAQVSFIGMALVSKSMNILLSPKVLMICSLNRAWCLPLNPSWSSLTKVRWALKTPFI
jgi:hypothetical protein